MGRNASPTSLVCQWLCKGKVCDHGYGLKGPYVGEIALTGPKSSSKTSAVCSIAKLCVCRVDVFVRELVCGLFGGLHGSSGEWHVMSR